MIQIRRYFLAGAVVLANHAYAAQSPLDVFPVKPVRMVVQPAPGGSSDIVRRIIAQAQAARWSQAVVVDNRPGSGGTIGNDIVAKSAPDGYTMLLSSSTMATTPLYCNAAADIIRDFQPISLIASQLSIIVARPAVPAKSLKEPIALMKSQPDMLAFGSAGVGIASGSPVWRGEPPTSTSKPIEGPVYGGEY